MRFSLRHLFAIMTVLAVIAASFRLITSEERSNRDVYIEYIGFSEEGVENRLIDILEKEGFEEVARWDPTLSLIPTDAPFRGGGEKEVFVFTDRYFEKEIDRGKIGCALGVDLRYFNKGACLCRTRAYFSGRAGYWRWAPQDQCRRLG